MNKMTTFPTFERGAGGDGNGRIASGAALNTSFRLRIHMRPFADRCQRLGQALVEESLDALIITSPINVSYLTGFSGESSYLVLTRDRILLVSDGRFTAQLAEECPGLETYIRPPSQTLAAAAGVVLNKLAVRSIGFESGHLTVAEFEGLRDNAVTANWKPGKDRVEKLRQCKDAGELEQIRAAIRIAERAFAMFRAFLRPEDQEKDLADAMESYIRRAGGRCGSFPSIIAVGERAALPHAPPTRKRVCEASLLLIDWGASGAFYKSDLTRVLLTHNTSPQRGHEHGIDARVREVYNVVLQAQARAIAAVCPGVQAKAVDAAARDCIAEAGFGDYFSHGLGHGIGLQIHEAPFLKPGADTLLEAGMVITIEPGIYLPGWGGVRIEDDILVTPEGCEVLTHVPKELEANIADF
jgi:Xaa-Pro aminopeptidase